MAMKPHPGGGWPLENLGKSYMSHSLNKETRTYGGSSGYSSGATKNKLLPGSFIIRGKNVPPKMVVKTIIHRKIDGKMRKLAKEGYTSFQTAISMGFVFTVEHHDAHGNVQITHHTGIR